MRSGVFTCVLGSVDFNSVEGFLTVFGVQFLVLKRYAAQFVSTQNRIQNIGVVNIRIACSYGDYRPCKTNDVSQEKNLQPTFTCDFEISDLVNTRCL